MTVQPTPTVVFDLGGVLVDWDPRYLYRKLLPDDEAVEKFLAEVTTPQWNREQDAGRSWDEAVAVLSEQFPEHSELIAAYHHRWTEMISGQIDGTVTTLRALHEAGVPLYALTNWSAEKFPYARDTFEWMSWFRGIVVSGAERLVKPDPRIYHTLLDRYGVQASSAVYIDDSLPNVEAARVLGFTAIHFTGPDQLAADLAAVGLPVNGKEASA